ncbi:MAG: thioredoxin family protein [Bacteroidota bacterium]
MKTISCIISILFASLSFAQEIEWMTMNEALEAQEKTPKKIFLDVYTDWCGPCKTMDKKTFSNPDVATYINKNFYPVKFNAEGTETVFYNDFEYTNPNHNPDKKGRNAQHLFAGALKVRAYPTIVFFDENGKVISPVPGYQTVEKIEIYLKMIASDDYKEVDTPEKWEAYQKEFDNTFSN